MSLIYLENIWRTHYLYFNLSPWLWFLGSEPNCDVSIMVPRNTVWKVHAMDKLKINCTVDIKSRCLKNMTAKWCRIDDDNTCRPLKYSNYTTINWTQVTNSQRQMFLIFHNISMQDAGLYRCEIQSPATVISHSINVTVTGKHIILIYTIYSIYFMYALKKDINTDNLTNTASQMLWYTLFCLFYLPTTGNNINKNCNQAEICLTFDIRQC